MSDQFSRTRLMLGDEAVKKLAASRVAVFGVGGVGGYAAEALARAGIGELELIDSDTVSESNRNRQIYALNSTVGMYKVDVAEKRIKRGQKVLDFCPCAVYDNDISGQLNIVCHFRSASGICVARAPRPQAPRAPRTEMVANVYDLQVSRRF